MERHPLIHGARFIESSPNPPTDRLAKSSGIRCAAEGNSHHGRVFFPCEPWVDLSVHERQILSQKRNSDGNDAWLAVVRIEDQAWCVMKEGAAREAKRSSWRPPDANDPWTRYVLNYFRTSFVKGDGKFAGLGIAILPVVGPTITRYDDGSLLGLHIDSWYRSSLMERKDAPNRISVNLGDLDRFFFYINLGVDRLYQLVLRDCAVPPSPSPPDIIARFMSTFPNYPVVRVRVRPGEAYIAPTEYLIHDAGSAGEMDVTLVCRGRFSVPGSGFDSRITAEVGARANA